MGYISMGYISDLLSSFAHDTIMTSHDLQISLATRNHIEN